MQIILRLGGSIIASPVKPNLINEYVNVLENLTERGHRLIVIVGGGGLAREFISVSKSLGLCKADQDEIAISISRVFALLFVRKLGKLACESVPVTLERAIECSEKAKIVIMGGLKPGMTTDTVAAMLAEKIKADLIVKATDQDGIYDKDPRKYPDAVKFDRLTFDELPRVFGEGEHEAGIHQILDPEAVKLLKRGMCKVVVVNGSQPRNVLLAIAGKPVGTSIG